MDLKAGRASLHETKNGEQRTLPLAGKALEALRQLKLQNSARSEYLFPSPTVVLDPKAGKPQLDAPNEPSRRCNDRLDAAQAPCARGAVAKIYLKGP